MTKILLWIKISFIFIYHRYINILSLLKTGEEIQASGKPKPTNGRPKLSKKQGIPYPNVKLPDVIEDLEYLQGPILTLLGDEYGNLFIEKYCEEDNDSMRMLRVRTSQKLVDDYLSRSISMYDLLEMSDNGICVLVDYFTSGSFDATILHIDNVPEYYMPRKTAFHEPSLRE